MHSQGALASTNASHSQNKGASTIKDAGPSLPPSVSSSGNPLRVTVALSNTKARISFNGNENDIQRIAGCLSHSFAGIPNQINEEWAPQIYSLECWGRAWGRSKTSARIEWQFPSAFLNTERAQTLLSAILTPLSLALDIKQEPGEFFSPWLPTRHYALVVENEIILSPDAAIAACIKFLEYTKPFHEKIVSATLINANPDLITLHSSSHHVSDRKKCHSHRLFKAIPAEASSVSSPPPNALMLQRSVNRPPPPSATTTRNVESLDTVQQLFHAAALRL
jgi:hypothetical protein